jgi:predicted PurR-regulated permease PerM
MTTDTNAPHSPPPTTIVRPEHLYKFAGLLLLLGLLYRHYETISRVLLLVYAASMLAVALNALAKRLPLQRRWSAGLIGIAVLCSLAAAVWFGGSMLLGQLRAFVDAFPEMERELRGWGDTVRDRVGLDIELVGDRVAEAVSGFFGDLSGSDIAGRASGLLEALTVPVLVFFGALFALAKPNEQLLVPLLQAVPQPRRAAFRRFLSLMGERIVGWVKGQIISMTTVGVLATIAFYLIGLPYAFLLGAVNGLAEFVPIIGPWVGGIPAVVVAFLDDPTKGLWTAVAILAIQQVESQLITPLVMSKTADVHPFVTLFSIVLFGGLFGFLGILLAVPLVLLIWTIVQVFWVERAIHAGDDRIPPVASE